MHRFSNRWQKHEPRNKPSSSAPFFTWFNRSFYWGRDIYLRIVGALFHKIRYLAIFVIIVVATGLLFQRMPTAYLRTKIRESSTSRCFGELDHGANQKVLTEYRIIF